MRAQTNASYLVRAGSALLLIDCGPAILQQLDQVGLTPGAITHVFITHRHGDHTLGYPLFLLWWLIHQAEKGTLPTPATLRVMPVDPEPMLTLSTVPLT